jgi:hypothetical protein
MPAERTDYETLRHALNVAQDLKAREAELDRAAEDTVDPETDRSCDRGLLPSEGHANRTAKS